MIEASHPTEANRQLHHFRHLLNGNGIDIASGGEPIVPWAISLDLPESEYARYNSNQAPRGVINWRGDVLDLPLKDRTCDWVLASHILEDFDDWLPPLKEWLRVVKPGGHLILLMPDKELFAEAVRKGQPPNCAHKHEPVVGEVTTFFKMYAQKFQVLTDRRTKSFPGDYNLLAIVKRL